MCRMLQVSTSGYYAWKHRPESRQAAANRRLGERIVQLHSGSRGTYGVRRIHAALRQEQILCSKQRVARLMNKAGLQGKGHARRRPRTTVRDMARPVAPNLLNRDFSADRPNAKWLADITYIDTLEGFLYLAGVWIGCFFSSCRGLGYGRPHA